MQIQLTNLNNQIVFGKRFTPTKGLYPIFDELIDQIYKKIQTHQITLAEARNMAFKLEYSDLMLSASVINRITKKPYYIRVNHFMDMEKYKRGDFAHAITQTDNFRLQYPVAGYSTELLKAECQIFKIYYNMNKSKNSNDKHYNNDFIRRNTEKMNRVVREYENRLHHKVHILSSGDNILIKRAYHTYNRLFGNFNNLILHDFYQQENIVTTHASSLSDSIIVYLIFNSKGEIIESEVKTKLNIFNNEDFELLQNVLEVWNKIKKEYKNGH